MPCIILVAKDARVHRGGVSPGYTIRGCGVLEGGKLAMCWWMSRALGVVMKS